MKITITDRQTTTKIEKSALRLAAQAALRNQRASAKAELTVALVDDDAIRRLNLSYRGKDKPTDVLSFATGETDHPELKDYLGDIIISVETAERQAREAGIAVLQETVMLVVHGTLHLLGLDDETPREQRTMMRVQDEILKQLQEKIPSEAEAAEEEQAVAEPQAAAPPRRRHRRRSRKKKEVVADA